MIAKKRVGIYGGTFNPPHNGHVGAAEAFCRDALLDELIIMPDFLPPHKEIANTISPSDRLRMCDLAFSHIEKAYVSDMEIKRGGRSYTYITLEELERPDAELYFLCGTDMLLTLSEWVRPERIFELATICYVRRENDEATSALIAQRVEEYEEKYSARIIKIVPDEVKVVSSSELRESLKKGFDIGALPISVLEYIKEKGLYK